jgi:hypothetical protein
MRARVAHQVAFLVALPARGLDHRVVVHTTILLRTQAPHYMERGIEGATRGQKLSGTR